MGSLPGPLTQGHILECPSLCPASPAGLGLPHCLCAGCRNSNLVVPEAHNCDLGPHRGSFWSLLSSSVCVPQGTWVRQMWSWREATLLPLQEAVGEGKRFFLDPP